ncbi:hypothetical protein K2P97_11290 [bacterium]|nr:hypothetical protein [bacterium]
MKPTSTIFVLIFSLLNLQFAEAKIFKNAYISFEMQDNWSCKLEQTEWVCRADDPIEAKEAVIVLTAKEKGPSDEFNIYEDHMNNSVQSVSKSGVTLTSTVKYKAVTLKINDHPWLDGLHSDSEIQNYYTRYLATVKENIGLLVTFSAHNRFYAKHSPNFDKTIQSLKIIASKDFLKSIDTNQAGFGEYAGNNEGPNGLMMVDPDRELGSGSFVGRLLKDKMILGGILFILALLLFVALKLYQKSRNR